MVKLSSIAPVADFPWPRAIEASIVAFGRPCFFAIAMAVASCRLILGSGPYPMLGQLSQR